MLSQVNDLQVKCLILWDEIYNEGFLINEKGYRLIFLIIYKFT